MRQQKWLFFVQCFALWLTIGVLPTQQTLADKQKGFPDLRKGLTSFGAAIVDDWLYVYGGHYGRAHEYSTATQSNELSRLNLKKQDQWETISKGPRLQGLAMVAYNGKLYRVGGFTAHNDAGEEHDLESVADFAEYDPARNKWRELPSMPVPRSSHDAVVIGDKLHVVGGWAMISGKTDWHGTSYVVDLSHKELKWQPLPKQPFVRRALSVGQFEGKLYVIGGIQKVGGPSTAVDIFDPATNQWSKGPNLVGEGMTGFGSSAFAVSKELYVSTYSGNLQRLSADAKSWSVVAKLKEDRFFHRMLPLGAESLILVGGASMQSGKRLSLETVHLSKQTD